MEPILGIKVEDIELSNIRIKMEVHEAICTDMFDDENENDHIDLITGEIIYFDPEMFDEDPELDDHVIGQFNLKILYGSEQKIFNTLENQSITDLKYAEELFDINYTNNGFGYEVKEEYYDLMSEVYENSFLILDRIEIDERYRGKRILDRVIGTIKRTFKQPILTKPFPLQHEGKVDQRTFTSDKRKVVNAYKRCGFVRARKRSEYLIRW